jgi:hypothetical protein
MQRALLERHACSRMSDADSILADIFLQATPRPFPRCRTPSASGQKEPCGRVSFATRGSCEWRRAASVPIKSSPVERQRTHVRAGELLARGSRMCKLPRRASRAIRASRRSSKMGMDRMGVVAVDQKRRLRRRSRLRPREAADLDKTCKPACSAAQRSASPAVHARHGTMLSSGSAWRVPRVSHGEWRCQDESQSDDRCSSTGAV